MDIHIRHIFEPVIKLTKDGLYTINGFHHDINNVIEKSGSLFRLLDKKIDASGFYKATIEIIGNNATKFTEKSFFPAHWSPEQVMQEIHYVMGNMQLVHKELCENFIIVKDITKHIIDAQQSSPFLIFIGQTKEHIPLFAVFNTKIQSFISIYPFLK